MYVEAEENLVIENEMQQSNLGLQRLDKIQSKLSLFLYQRKTEEWTSGKARYETQNYFGLVFK